MSDKCWKLFSSSTKEQVAEKLNKLVDLWSTKTNIMRHTQSDWKYFKKAYEDSKDK